MQSAGDSDSSCPTEANADELEWGMAKAIEKAPAKDNGRRPKPAMSKVGRELTRIRRLIEKSGQKLLTRREIEREVAERRGAR